MDVRAAVVFMIIILLVPRFMSGTGTGRKILDVCLGKHRKGRDSPEIYLGGKSSSGKIAIFDTVTDNFFLYNGKRFMAGFIVFLVSCLACAAILPRPDFNLLLASVTGMSIAIMWGEILRGFKA